MNGPVGTRRAVVDLAESVAELIGGITSLVTATREQGIAIEELRRGQAAPERLDELTRNADAALRRTDEDLERAYARVVATLRAIAGEHG